MVELSGAFSRHRTKRLHVELALGKILSRQFLSLREILTHNDFIVFFFLYRNCSLLHVTVQYAAFSASLLGCSL